MVKAKTFHATGEMGIDGSRFLMLLYGGERRALLPMIVPSPQPGVYAPLLTGHFW